MKEESIRVPQVWVLVEDGLFTITIPEKPAFAKWSVRVIEEVEFTAQTIDGQQVLHLQGMEIDFGNPVFFDGGELTENLKREFEIYESDIVMKKPWPWSKSKVEYVKSGALFRKKQKSFVRILCNHFVIIDKRTLN